MFNGYTATIPEELLDLIRGDPNVRGVSQNSWGYIQMWDEETEEGHDNTTVPEVSLFRPSISG